MIQQQNSLQNLDDSNTPFFQALLTTLEKTAHLLNVVRAREGQELGKIIDRFLTKFLDLLDHINARLPQVHEKLEQRLQERIAKISAAPVDNERLVQELALLLNRMDVTEEMDRINIHLREMAATLAKDESVGRRLDFLCQELNREANTLCAKAQDGEISKMGVEMKVIVEKLREQVQNLE